MYMDKKAGMLEPRNMYKSYTLGNYLAVNPKRLNISNISCIDTQTSIINIDGLQRLVDFLVSLYNTPVSQKIKSIYGIGYYRTYFELYDFAIRTNKNIRLNLLDFLKKDGKRELYYALKNINESMNYKEGCLFSQLSMLHKNKLSFNDFFIWIQSIVDTETTHRLQKNLIIRRLVGIDSANLQVIKSTTSAAIINPPTFEPKRSSFNDGSVDIQILKERNEARIKFNFMLSHYRNGIDLVLGYQEKSIFQKRYNCLNLNIQDIQEGIIIAGENSSSKELLRSYIYQSINNSSGLLLFSALNDKSMLSYIYQVATHFDVVDDVHVFYYGTDTLTHLDINHYIKANKIVLVLYPEFSDAAEHDVNILKSYQSINATISNIKESNIGKIGTKFPFNIYLNELSFPVWVENEIKLMITNLSNLYSYNVNYYIVNESLTLFYSAFCDYVLHRIKNVIILKNECGQEISRYLNMQKLRPVDFSKLGPLEFYYFSNNTLINPSKFNGIYMPIDIDINLEEHLN